MKPKVTLTISQLSRTTEVPTTTIRYYERVGLLEPADRSEGNYRLYDADSVRRLTFIRTAQRIGFTLEDVKVLLETPESETACQEVQSLIEERLVAVESQLKDLRRVRRVLQSSLGKCRDSESAGCHILEELSR